MWSQVPTPGWVGTGRTQDGRGAEGNTRRQFFAPFGDLDVPKGFVKNGDAIDWWLPIQALFVPSIILAWRLDFPPSLYLAAFVLLWLVFRSNLRDRVPFYLTNRGTWLAVSEILPRHGAFKFVDLGCGWGGGLAVLAKQCKSGEFLGVESAPLPFLLGWLSFRRDANCRIRFGDFWNEDLGCYDVVYAFLSPAPMPRLWRKARNEMKPGSLFISNTFGVPDLPPNETLTLQDVRAAKLLVWRM